MTHARTSILSWDYCFCFLESIQVHEKFYVNEDEVEYGWEYGRTKFGTWSLVNASQYVGTNIFNYCICRTTTNVATSSSSSSSPIRDPTIKLKSDNEASSPRTLNFFSIWPSSSFFNKPSQPTAFEQCYPSSCPPGNWRGILVPH